MKKTKKKKILVVQTMAPVFVEAMKALEKTKKYEVVGWTTHSAYQKSIQSVFPFAKVLNCFPLMRADVNYLCEQLKCQPDVSFLEPKKQNSFAKSRLFVTDCILHRGASLSSYTHQELSDDVNNYFVIAATLIKKLRPDIVLFEVPPHGMYDLALEDIARNKKIKILMTCQTHLPAISKFITAYRPHFKTLYLPEKQQASVAKKLEIAISGLSKKYSPFYQKPLFVKSQSSYFRSNRELYYDLKKSIKTVVKYKLQSFFIKEQQETHASSYVKKKNIKLYLEQGDYFHYAINKIFGVGHETFYKIHCIKKIAKLPHKKIFYVPLSLQPEMSTMPAAGFMFNQLTYLRLLFHATKNYNNIVVYVKENPNQFSYDSGPQTRSLEFYKEIINFNFKLVSLDISSREIIEKSDCVVITTGTAGFEAAHVYNKSIISFSENWYKGHPNIYQISTFSELQKAITNVKDDKPKTNNIQKLISFEKKFVKECVYFWADAATCKEYKFREEPMATNLANAVKILSR